MRARCHFHTSKIASIPYSNPFNTLSINAKFLFNLYALHCRCFFTALHGLPGYFLGAHKALQVFLYTNVSVI